MYEMMLQDQASVVPYCVVFRVLPEQLFRKIEDFKRILALCDLADVRIRSLGDSRK